MSLRNGSVLSDTLLNGPPYSEMEQAKRVERSVDSDDVWRTRRQSRSQVFDCGLDRQNRNASRPDECHVTRKRQRNVHVASPHALIWLPDGRWMSLAPDAPL